VRHIERNGQLCVMKMMLVVDRVLNASAARRLNRDDVMQM